jgi:hypothetical protein
MASTSTKTAAAIVGAATIAGVALWGGAHLTAPTSTSVGGPCVPETICELPCVDRATARDSLCLGCHDGSVAPSVIATHTVGGAITEHPTSVPYTQTRQGTAIIFGGPTDAALVIAEGEVRCVTCHSYWAVPRQPGWLARPYSGFCECCHEK